MGWIISAHGSYESTGDHKIFLNGKKVYFWVQDNQGLTNVRAWPVFNHLLARGIGDSPLPPVPSPKDYVWNYVAIGTNEFPSGLFASGKGAGATCANNLLCALPSGMRWTLGDILDHPECPEEVYWLCCTYIDTQKNPGLLPTHPLTIATK